jgi:hypothetical protein
MAIVTVLADWGGGGGGNDGKRVKASLLNGRKALFTSFSSLYLFPIFALPKKSYRPPIFYTEYRYCTNKVHTWDILLIVLQNGFPFPG